MRLLLVSQDFPPDVGGVQTYAVGLAERLASRATSLAVVAPARPGAEAVDRALPFEVHRLPALGPNLLALSALPRLPRLCRAGRIDVAIHAQWQPALASIFARRRTGFPRQIAVAAHGRELLFNPYRLPGLRWAYDRLRRLVFEQADLLLPVSGYTADLLEDLGASPERITVVPNGTDPASFQPSESHAPHSSSRPVLLTACRLVPRKGVDTTLHALPRVLEEYPGLVYLVAGDGPDRARLEALTRSLRLDEHVRFLGAITDGRLLDLYGACDVFVMPSRDAPPDVEGFGLVFLEASACGRPVVGTRVGGIPEAVEDGVTGLLVPPDAPAELATALLRLLNDPAYAARLGAQGRRRVLDGYTWDHTAERVMAALRPLVPGAEATPAPPPLVRAS